MDGLLLSLDEKKYIRDGIEAHIRMDGRRLDEQRPLYISTDVLPQASGSTLVRLGDTLVLVGIQASIGTPCIETPGNGRFILSVDSSSMMNHDRSFGEQYLEEIQAFIVESLFPTLPLHQLCIVSGELCWVLHIEAQVSRQNVNND